MHARVTLADAGLALYLATALVVMAVVGPQWLRGLPDGFRVMTVMAGGVGALQLLGMLVSLLVVEPWKRRRTVYEVTNYRVIVIRGPGAGDVASVYLDQFDEPTVHRHRDGTGDVLLGSRSGGTQGRRLAGLSRSGGLGLAAVSSVTVLQAVHDAEQACQVIAGAQRRMRDGEIDVFSSPGHLAGPGVPGEITLAADEEVLWTGGPARIPWWFGGHDVYLTVFALAWLAFVTGMGVLTVRLGNAAFLVFLVPFAFVGGVYPSAGRVVHRRLLIKRSCYVLTSHRLITTWRPLGGGTPVVVQARLGVLLPPTLRGTSVVTGRVFADGSSQRYRWRELTWPATTVTPPAFIALANAQEIAGLIGAAQIATRAPANNQRPHAE